MKVLIIGENSYIGRNIGQWFLQKEEPPVVAYLSVRDDNWKAVDISDCDVVIFAAAIVHDKTVKDWDLYRRVNAELPLAFAEYAKKSGVRQFVFISTAGVFKAEKSLPAGTVIHDATPLEPDGLYGKSKRLGEQLLWKLNGDDFHVSIIRPSNVYGKNCRGNYIPLFTKITKLMPILPNAFDDVKQGLVYIDNLSELCWLVANSSISGIYHAQDQRCVSSYEIMTMIAQALEKKKPSIRCTGLMRLVQGLPPVKKLFGGICYDQKMSQCALGDYWVVDIEEGFRRTISQS